MKFVNGPARFTTGFHSYLRLFWLRSHGICSWELFSTSDGISPSVKPPVLLHLIVRVLERCQYSSRSSCFSMAVPYDLDVVHQHIRAIHQRLCITPVI